VRIYVYIYIYSINAQWRRNESQEMPNEMPNGEGKVTQEMPNGEGKVTKYKTVVPVRTR